MARVNILKIESMGDFEWPFVRNQAVGKHLPECIYVTHEHIVRYANINALELRTTRLLTNVRCDMSIRIT